MACEGVREKPQTSEADLRKVFRSAGDSASALRGAEQFDLIRQKWARVVDLLDADPTLTSDEAENMADPEYREQRAELKEIDEERLAAHNAGASWMSTKPEVETAPVEQSELDRCRYAVRTVLETRLTPMRHLHLVDLLPEWRGRIAGVLSDFVMEGVVAKSKGEDGYMRYAMAGAQAPEPIETVLDHYRDGGTYAGPVELRKEIIASRNGERGRPDPRCDEGLDRTAEEERRPKVEALCPLPAVPCHRREVQGPLAEDEGGKVMAKQTRRGCEITVTVPTEPLAGRAKNVPVMEVQVQDEGVAILHYPIPEGQAITFHVGGSIVAYMQRTEAPVPGRRHVRNRRFP